MVAKRKRMQGKRYVKKRRYNSGVRSNSARHLQAVARRAIAASLDRNIETKTSVYSSADGGEIFHNNFITLDNVVLKTTPGPFDADNSNADNRIGDKIKLKGVSFKAMVELNERYSDVTFRMMVVKCAKGDTPTRATLFTGLSGNKMIDTIAKERYTVLAQKVFKLKAPGMGSDGGTSGVTAGIVEAGGNYPRLSRATKIVKLWVPGKRFNKSGFITYENASSQTKFFDYHVLLYAYSNYTTAQDIWYVGRCNDYVKVMYYKDA